MEQYCENGNVLTYGSKDRDGSITQGGYSTFIVVDEDFVIEGPRSYRPRQPGRCCARASRLLSAAPLECRAGEEGRRGRARRARSHGGQAGRRDGRRGDRAQDFQEQARGREAIRREDRARRRARSGPSKHMRSLDLILDTVPYQHDLDRLIPLLELRREPLHGRRPEGHRAESSSAVLPAAAPDLVHELADRRHPRDPGTVDFCAVHGIGPISTRSRRRRSTRPDERVLKSDVRYRFVIDMTRT